MTTAQKNFEIKYVNPRTGEWETIEVLFNDSAEFPASMWADDYGYALADKGQYSIKEVLDN